jgi:hypothetical protein
VLAGDGLPEGSTNLVTLLKLLILVVSRVFSWLPESLVVMFLLAFLLFLFDSWDV